MKLVISRIPGFVYSLIMLTLFPVVSQAQMYPQIIKLIGTGNTNVAAQGWSTSISADGKTIVSGGFQDDSNHGAIWVYTFDGFEFGQLGNKLVGTGNSGAAQQGWSVSASADGKTIIVGGYHDNGNIGAAWIYTFNGTGYIQIGNKLVSNDYTGESWQGYSVSISADGKTAIVGGAGDNAFIGAMWVYTFNGTEFVQAGNKLVGSGNTGTAYQGTSVSISSDGKTIIEGGKTDNFNLGAAWVFTYNGKNFAQAGNKLVGTGNAGMSQQGSAVDISADGKVAVVGGFADNNFSGSVWVYTFNGTNYMQLGTKLGGYSGGEQGVSVSITSDGKKIITGIPNRKEVWIYEFNEADYIQSGEKLSGLDVGSTYQGTSTDISSDGKTIISGSPYDGNGITWIFSNNNFICSKPTITGINNDTNTCAGSAFTLSIDATGSGLLSYEWYKEQTLLASGYSYKYSFNSLTTTDEGNYFCVVRNACGTATSAGINLTVNTPDIIANVLPGAICKGNIVTITGSGAPLLTVSGGISLNEGFIPVASSAYTITGIDALGCVRTVIINTTVNGIPTLNVSGNRIICARSPLTLRASGANIYYWSNASSTETITIRPDSSMILSVSGFDSNNCFNTFLVNLTVNSLPEVSLDLSTINNTCDTLRSVILGGGKPSGGIYLYQGTSSNELNISQAGDYPIVYRYRGSNSCINEASDTLTSKLCTVPGLCERPDPPCGCPGRKCLKVYSAFTPNSDGINDTWYIDTLPTDNLVVIFDKWGDEVFRKVNYDNDWNGTQKGKALPEGIYYYFVQTDRDKKKYTGTVSIVR